ncbi:hypothetical protein [Cellvibrio sp. QJXJ]|uniref:hypothetical protein n=1 Tax=Cellvibrio sp. QJXJ TaxID=2964606 RepID=UPI0021C3D253|nr:hypothetical protein [Cellvibrio sp. QJXJ]UUA75229.1 hypothetical protein NNX04_22485 [Cellvibrio sp. QJXJ]
MTSVEAIQVIWPHGNKNICTARIERCVVKIRKKLELYGFYVSLHGSYMHMAMEVVAQELGGKVIHKSSNDTVSLDIR